ncbi:hypothetical protein ACFLUV_05495, partial [Elusimicrobiota bacterium]
MLKKYKILFFVIVSVSLIFYYLARNYDYIGSFNDDAWYANAARYMAGVQTENKRLTGRPLGYPVLLVPAARLFPDNISMLRYPSMLFILAVPFLIFYFLKDIFKEKSELL